MLYTRKYQIIKKLYNKKSYIIKRVIYLNKLNTQVLYLKNIYNIKKDYILKKLCT